MLGSPLNGARYPNCDFPASTKTISLLTTAETSRHPPSLNPCSLDNPACKLILVTAGQSLLNGGKFSFLLIRYLNIYLSVPSQGKAETYPSSSQYPFGAVIQGEISISQVSCESDWFRTDKPPYPRQPVSPLRGHEISLTFPAMSLPFNGTVPLPRYSPAPFSRDKD